MMNLADKRICVTGGAGFLGSHVVAELQARGCQNVFVPRSTTYDLTTDRGVTRMFEKVRPQVVIHCAAYCGGIGLNQATPFRMLHDNLLINTHVLQACVGFDTEKVIAIGSVCAYPKNTPCPFKETDLWNGYPEETNAPYGLAKRILLTQCQTYREAFGLNAVYLLPANLYGPRDNFDLQTSHVIPALIRKIIEARQAGEKSITLWGDGTPTRDFLYVEDAARAIVEAAERYDSPEPMNVGTGVETSIESVAHTIAAFAKYHGFVNRDTAKPNGQPRRVLDCSRATAFGFTPQVGLSLGIVKTILWYEAANNITRPIKPEPVDEFPVLSSDPHPVMITVPADVLEPEDE